MILISENIFRNLIPRITQSNEEKINNIPTQTKEESSQIKKFQDIKKKMEKEKKNFTLKSKKEKNDT